MSWLRRFPGKDGALTGEGQRDPKLSGPQPGDHRSAPDIREPNAWALPARHDVPMVAATGGMQKHFTELPARNAGVINFNSGVLSGEQPRG